MNNNIWFSVVEWPPEYDCENTIEVSHFSSQEKCESSLKDYLEDIFERVFETLDLALNEAVLRDFKVWYAAAVVK